MKNSAKVLCLLAAAGAVASIAPRVSAQPFVVNVNGATLLENFFRAPASTNDYIDVDGDGVAGILSSVVVDQLAPTYSNDANQTNGLVPTLGVGAGQTPGLYFIVNYRAVGSVNGYQETVDWGRDFNLLQGAINNAGDPLALANRGYIPVRTSERSFSNRTQFINAGAPQAGTNIYNFANPAGQYVRQNTTAGNLFRPTVAASNGTAAAGGYLADVAPVDVPSFWAVRGSAGTPIATRLPGQGGYGQNPATSLNKDGTQFLDGLGQPFGHQLASLVSFGGVQRNLFTTPAAANANTIFDTQIAFAPISAMVNLGVGREQIDKSDLRHVFATGRLKSGENLMAVTRDAGSGTRNGFNNSTGLDPSWGVGDNILGLSSLTQNNQAGPNFTPSNKSGSGGMEATLQNTRIGIGYSGSERGGVGPGNPATITNGRLECLAVRDDFNGGTLYVRPTIGNILTPSSAANGYLIGGPAIFATLGDPRSSVAPAGFAAPAVGFNAGNTNPPMSNPYAAAYLNNISRSIAAFNALPLAPQNEFMPGEIAATLFIPPAALQFSQNVTNPTTFSVNPGFVPSLATAVSSISILGQPVFTSYGLGANGRNGINPTRQTNIGAGTLPLPAGFVYSDGLLANYRSQGPAGDRTSGVNLTYAAACLTRNRIGGDFNGDGLRNVNDTVEMVRAWRFVNGQTASWNAPNGTGAIAGAPGSDACIEILGDFNADGSFGRRWTAAGPVFVADREDVRYFADGLAMTTGANPVLDRKAGFEAVDNAWFTLTAGNNFFGTTLATGKPWVVGGSRGDVTNNLGRATRGFAPIADGTINAADIDYVYKQFKTNPTAISGQIDWAVTAQAGNADLTADITGDLLINQADVDDLVFNILQTCYGDVNLDGTATATDLTIANSNLGNAGGWAQGDMDGDGQVTAIDLAIINTAILNNCGPVLPACNPADIAQTDGAPGADACVNNGDFSLFFSEFFAAECSATCGILPVVACNPADIAATDGSIGADGCVDNGDFSLFFSSFFSAVCPNCAG